MTSLIHSRLKEIAKECGGNRALCEKSGVSERTFANWLAGSSEPKIIGISAIAQAAGVTIDWIVTGAKPKQRLGSRPQPSQDTVLVAWVAHGLVGDASLKSTERLILKDHLPFSKNFLEKHLGHTNFDQLCILQTHGDSMEPTMRDGDFVLIDRSQHKLQDGLASYIFKDSIYIKRLINVLNGIEVISDNQPLYPTQHIPYDDIQHFKPIGRVIWVGKSLL